MRVVPTHNPLFDSQRVPSVATLRVSAIWGLPQLLQEFDITLATVLAEASLPAGLFDDRENPLTYPELERLLAACERATRCEHFGLLAGQRSRLADMGLAGEAALCEPTAGDALRTFIDYFNLHDSAATMGLLDNGCTARFVYAIAERDLRDTRHFQHGAIAIACNVLQDVFGPEWTPVEVRLATRSPADPSPFVEFFRAPVRFDCQESAVVFARHCLDQPLPPRDESYRRDVLERAAAQRAQMLADFPATLRRIVRKQLLMGAFSMDDIAGLLSMHRRTLDRWLKRCGLQYGELVESVKENVARQLLRDTDLPIQQVAETLRFSSGANFATAFRRRLGMTPSQYRRHAPA
jgi:AraC-like DNA-binding protein